MLTPTELIRRALDDDAIHTDAIVTKQHADDLASELGLAFKNLGLRIIESGPYGNLDRATEICDEVEGLLRVQGELKRAFKNDELDGGWKTALEHPLYLQAEARKVALQDELKGLI